MQSSFKEVSLYLHVFKLAAHTELLLFLGKIEPAFDYVFALEDTLKANAYLMSHRARGRVAVRADPEAE